MARSLRFRRAKVAPDRLAAYLAAVGRAAGRRERAGQHLWLFRHAEHSDIFVEFREGPDAAALAPNAAEAELEWFADYPEDDGAVWLEVRPDREPSPDTR